MTRRNRMKPLTKESESARKRASKTRCCSPGIKKRCHLIMRIFFREQLPVSNRQIVYQSFFFTLVGGIIKIVVIQRREDASFNLLLFFNSFIWYRSFFLAFKVQRALAKFLTGEIPRRGLRTSNNRHQDGKNLLFFSFFLS